MPLRAFFVLERFREVYVEVPRKNGSQCPCGHFLFWNFGSVVFGDLSYSTTICRNALAGIFCFGTLAFIYGGLYFLYKVAMPLRAFFVLEHYLLCLGAVPVIL